MISRILVAEDNRILLDVLRFNLVRAGYEVLTAMNGLEALTVLREHQPIDLLITDCQMPGLSGVEVCTQVRQDPQL
ncbi:MAG: response regulator, partial [Planctomycetaceae bacterium]|nr:response regulator [Planctomycetaceae bacterium]